MKKILGALTLGLCSWAQAQPVENVGAETQSDTSILVSWDSVDSAAWYDLYQDSRRLTTGITDTEYLVSDLQPATGYQFFVTACDASGVCTVASAQANASTAPADDGGNDSGTDAMACDMSTSPQPVVSYTDNGDGTLTLSWCAVDGAEGYNLFIDNAYTDTYDATTNSATVSLMAGSDYQIAWFANGEYPAKSAPVSAPGDGSTGVDDDDSDPTADDVESAVQALELNSRDLPESVEIYFTRHAEKMTELAEQADGSLVEVCGESKCSEVLNPRGALRARLLAGLFADAGITDRLTHAFSSHKTRTRQTIEQIVAEAGLSGDDDKIADGIQEFPVMNPDGSAFATELDPESTTPSEAPVIAALLNLPAGSVALVAGHSGTLYDIMAGLGLEDVCLKDTVDSCDQDRYPIDDDVKVRDYGDIWKIVLENGTARFVYRTNLAFSLGFDNVAD